MNKKDIDILELMRESILKANKELGFRKQALNEQKSAFDEAFDPEKHMPKFQITKDWGIKGTTDANQIDAIVANLIDVSENNGLRRFKKTTKKMNEILGASYATEETLPSGEEQTGKIKLNEIISSMQLKNLFHAVIGSQDAKVAGKIYETLVARLAGGFTQQVETYSIEDFIDGENNYISLKAIKDTTPIAGSKVNLAIGLAKKPEGIYYLVTVKDSEENPFKVSTFSFKVTQGNFFYFLTGKKDRDSAKSEMDAIRKRIGTVKGELEKRREQKSSEYAKKAAALASAGGSKKAKEAQSLNEAFDVNVFSKETDEDKIVTAFKSIYPQEPASFDTIKGKFIELLTIAGKNIENDLSQKKLLDDVIKFSSKGAFMNLSADIADMVTGKTSDKIFKSKPFLELQKAITMLDGLSGIDLAEYAETNPELIRQIDLLKYNPEKIKSTDKLNRDEVINNINASIKNNEPKYISARNKIKNNLKPFFNLYNKLSDAVTGAKQEPVKSEEPKAYDIRASTAASEAGGYVAGFSQEIDNFWNELKDVSLVETFAETLNEAAGATETQFEVPISRAKAFAKDDKNAEYDETYPQIVVTYEGLKDSTTKSAELFREWAQPLYEGMHILTQGVNRYFIEDNVAGLTVAKDGVTKVDKQVDRLSGMKAGEIATPEESLHESKQPSLKEHLKKAPLDDILDELLK